MRSVGIDIGSSSIKVVEVVASNKGLAVTKFFQHPLGVNPAFDPEIEILEFLKNLSQSYDPNHTKITLGLKQDFISARHKVFPFQDRQKILKSLPFELEEDLPFSTETAIFDAKICRFVGNQAEVLAVASPRHRITGALQRTKDANLDIHILSSEAVALANCIENWVEAPPAVPAPAILPETNVGGHGSNLDHEASPTRPIQVLVHIGHTRTLVLALHENKLVGIRSLFWGAKNIIDAIVRKYEIPYVEASKEFQTKAFILLNRDQASYDQIVFSDTIANQIRDFSKELRIAIMEFKAEFNADLQSVLLSGGGGQIQNLNAYLTTQLDLNVNRISLFKNFAHVSFEKTPYIEAAGGVALGLAIEGLKKPRNPAINFLKGDLARQNKALKLFWEKWGTSLQLVGVFYVMFFIYASLRESSSLSLLEAEQEHFTKQAKVVTNQTKGNPENIAKTYIKNLNKRIKELKALKSATQINSAMDVLKKISDAMPAKNQVQLNIHSILIQDQKAIIHGSAGNVAELNLIQQAISRAAADGKMQDLKSADPVAPPAVGFKYEIKVDRGIASNANDKTETNSHSDKSKAHQ